MLTGRLAFEGETATDIMARIVTGQPDLNLLPSGTPPSIRALLAATLNKNVQHRLQHIGDMRLFLDENLFPSVEKTAEAVSGGKKQFALVAALAVALVMALILAVLYFRRAPADTTAMRFGISIPGLVNNAVAISPDGQRIAFIVQSDDGQRSLWVRPIDSEKAQQVSGTENAPAFLWSPDSRYLAFLSAGKLKKIDPSGGSAQVICDVAGARFFTWNRTGTILFGRSSDNVIVSVADTGGEVKPVTRLDASRKEGFHGLPVFLPDGNRFLYAAAGGVPDTSGIYVASLDSKTAPTRVVPLSIVRFTGMAYAPPGYLVYAVEGKLIAHRFDPEAAKVEGDPMTLSDDIDGGFAVTDTGLLTFRKNAPSNASNKQLTWFDREGRQVQQIGAMANYGGIELSPTGDRLAVDIVTDNNRDIWVIDLARNVPSRITFDPANDWTASWSPDGSRLTFASAGRGNQPQQIYQKSSSGVGVDELVATDGEPSIPAQWSPDNKFIAFSRAQGGGSGGNDMWLLPLTGDRKPRPFLQTPFDKIQARISPDARWIAYTTNESGSFQVVVQSFPDPNGGKWQISADGGVEPKWRHDGKELYYLALDGKLMSVPIKAARTFEAERPVPLFQTVLTVNRTRPDRDRRYDVTHDGQRFLIVTPGNRFGAVPVTVVVNWASAFKK
jgi:eukaryotic-like serine/threonine-protein kinase